jgi:hypothetical protein
LSSQETDARTTRTEASTSIDCDPALSGLAKFCFSFLSCSLSSLAALQRFLQFRDSAILPMLSGFPCVSILADRFASLLYCYSH